MKWYLKVVRDNYANFSGRARRQEYWMFFLFNTIFIYAGIFLLGMVAVAIESPFILFLAYIYMFGVMIPSLAVGVRRMHDVGKSGWYLLIPIYSFILAVTEGERRANQYGPDPKSPGEDINEIGKIQTN
ncbi:DUF805 domain-containing protein [Subsaxibacter sp. CAU 1640]|uniref:DUF805 domain-containing protein n=1 Tax=Subsaxibacter sp. CAU 1640 TaxID=2933271 RepID=UPI0020058E3E|nr:DUF805 domain-containing protein [Subsaxibacter sp. CAU 1640]MCK7591462.1 DUF805 domain-containing protein [Subsaxibacter sp. CAU 1640]